MPHDLRKLISEHSHLRAWRDDAAYSIIAFADDTGYSLMDVIAEVERFIVQETKVSDSAGRRVPAGRRGYTLRRGRLVELGPSAGKPPKIVDADCHPHLKAREAPKKTKRR